MLRRVCVDISNRYEITFLEIGADQDRVHFLVQSVPMYSPKKIVQTIKSITGREVLRRVPSVKAQLWGGAFWSSGYYINTVGRNGSEEAIHHYVASQGREAEYRTFPAEDSEACRRFRACVAARAILGALGYAAFLFF